MRLLGISIIVVVMVLTTMGAEGGYPPSTGYGYPAPKQYPYLPAPPGETPQCAKHGATYCEKIDTYPTEVISYLLYKYGGTYEQFIKSESDRDFILISKTYGPAPYDSYKPQQGGYGGHAGPGPTYLPPSNHYQKQQQQPFNNRSTSAHNNGKQYVASYYRNPNQNQNRYQREHNNQNPGGYGSSFAIQNQLSPALAVPPIVHSIWWNHRDANNNMAFPHMQQYNNNQHQRWKRRVKRQSENSLCPIRSNYISAQAAMNNDGNWMYVVNMQDTQYRQQVRTEVCARGDGSPCSGLCSTPPGFSATCRQKYVQKRLVALDGSGGSLSNEVFWFPHCCSCEVTG